jgi:hypothetical protein
VKYEKRNYMMTIFNADVKNNRYTQIADFPLFTASVVSNQVFMTLSRIRN